jgi:sterol desaturase/sphingolipid hydroxylase (fatty acid hydroxylase superfamily)
LHHSRAWQESNANFANTVMIFDVLFGTYAKPQPVGPEAMGTDEELPDGFWAQLTSPFRH